MVDVITKSVAMSELPDFDHWKYHIRYWWGIYHVREFYYKVKNFFFPKQSWLVKGMYHDWCDKPELIQEVLYRCIVNYVEQEECFESNDWSQGDTYQECAAFITDCYDWIKIRRPQLVKQIDTIVSNGCQTTEFIKWVEEGGEYPQDKRPYDEIYPNLNKLEKELEEADQKYLTGIVKWHQYLWT